jgi:hypothetical protein
MTMVFDVGDLVVGLRRVIDLHGALDVFGGLMSSPPATAGHPVSIRQSFGDSDSPCRPRSSACRTRCHDAEHSRKCVAKV